MNYNVEFKKLTLTNPAILNIASNFGRLLFWIKKKLGKVSMALNVISIATPENENKQMPIFSCKFILV